MIVVRQAPREPGRCFAATQSAERPPEQQPASPRQSTIKQSATPYVVALSLYTSIHIHLCVYIHTYMRARESICLRGRIDYGACANENKLEGFLAGVEGANAVRI